MQQPPTPSAPAAVTKPRRTSPYSHVTDTALMRLGHNSDVQSKRLEPVHKILFTEDYYIKTKGRNDYLKAIQAADGGHC